MDYAEIALISPTTELADKARDIIEKRNENIEVFTLDKNDVISDALRIAKELVSKGTKVIISRKGTATAITNSGLDVSVVTIHTTLSEYVKAIEVAKNVNGLVAFFFYETIMEDIESLCNMLNIKAKYYTFKTDKDCEILIKKALEEGAVLGIGGIMNQKYAEIYGLNHITIENTEESIINAIETAKQILLIQKEEAKKQMELKLKLERYEAVLNYTHDAIIAFDENGIIDVINPVAENIIKIAPGYGKGKNISQIIRNSDIFNTKSLGEKQLNQITNISGTYVSANRVPIVVDDELKGAVVTFQDIEVIQESEQKIRRSLNKKGLVAKYNFNDIIGESKSIKNTIEIARSYAESDLTILIQGETGTGKELFAQSIHNNSTRRDGPFVAINCAALSKSLLESELFGYVEGAFTGAVKGGKPGLFEMAHKGTIFLDEIGEIPVEIQAQLLRVIEEREVRRIGSDIITPINVRIIAATNKDLREEVKLDRFRKDLYYRISTLNLSIPPLRERGDDILIIAKHYFEKNLGLESNKYIDAFQNIMEKVKGYSWHGNIRELKNFVDRVCVLLKYHKDEYYIEHLIEEFFTNDENSQIKTTDNTFDLNQWEAEKIISALKNNNLSIQKTAEELGISRATLWRKMKKYNISI